MKICVYGAGAIGGLIGGRLSRAGAEVTMIARGANLAAIRANGLMLRSGGEDILTRPAVTDDPARAGVQDYIILALKAQVIPAIAAGLGPMLGPDTAVVTAANGVPWWYFYKQGGEFDGRHMERVDPGAVIWNTVGPERAIGCVVWPSAERVAPGMVEHTDSFRLPLGEPDGNRSDRALRLGKLLIAAGFKSPVKTRIRGEVWMKLQGNLSLNPVSLLTGMTLGEIAADKEARGLVRSMMDEAAAVAAKLGVSLALDAETRIDGAGATGAHKTSMLLDFESGREIEIEALTGAVIDLARLVGLDTPTIDDVYARVLEKTKAGGCLL